MSARGTLVVAAALLALAAAPRAAHSAAPAHTPPLARSTPPKSTVPKSLDRLEELVEDSYDRALTGKVAAPESTATRIWIAWTACRAVLAQDSLPDADATPADSAVASLLRVAATKPAALPMARAINAVSGGLDRLYDHYHPRRPAALLRLDYLGRELFLDARASGADAAKATRARIDSTWSALRPQVLAVKGRTSAARFDAALQAADQSLERGDFPAVASEALVLLDLVDKMEDLF